MEDKLLRLVIDRTDRDPGYKIYEFIPTAKRLFYLPLEKLTLQRRVRFLMELRRKYKVYYLETGGEIVAYCVVSRGGGRYSFAGADDIVVGPYFVSETHRGKRYSEILVSELLHWDGVSYRYAYDWVRKTNIPSLKCSAKCGFVKVETMDTVGLLRKLKICLDHVGEYYLLKYQRNGSEQ